MPVSHHWKLADVFTLEQAAYLWCGLEPEQLLLGQRMPADVAAVLQAFVGAYKLGTLHLDNATNAYATIGDYNKSFTNRAGLILFARSKNVYPEFLFDTVAGPSNLEMAKLFEEAGKDLKEHSEAVVETPRAAKGGRPAGYDWDACMGEIVRFADMEGLPGVQADLVRHLMSWFEERYDKSPADSVIKARISPLYGYLKSVGWKPKDG